MGTGEFNAGGNPAMDWHPIQGGVEIFLVASCYGNRDKLRPDGPLGSYADLTYKLFAIAGLLFKAGRCILWQLQHNSLMGFLSQKVKDNFPFQGKHCVIMFLPVHKQ